MKKKSLTKEEYETLVNNIVIAHDAWLEVWNLAVKGLKIDSREFRGICSAGKKILDVSLSLQIEGKFKKTSMFN